MYIFRIRRRQIICTHRTIFLTKTIYITLQQIPLEEVVIGPSTKTGHTFLINQSDKYDTSTINFRGYDMFRLLTVYFLHFENIGYHLLWPLQLLKIDFVMKIKNRIPAIICRLWFLKWLKCKLVSLELFPWKIQHKYYSIQRYKIVQENYYLIISSLK